MIGTNLKITMADGTEHVVPVTLKSSVEFERQFKVGLLKALTEEQKMEHLAYLGWASMKAAGHVVKVFDGWLDQVAEVSFMFEAKESPGKDVTT